ncbi:MAG: ATP-dependent metallopeptidase FtsH/Yme1/Tma family protein, partial [Actinomycetota bacterium]
MALIWGVAGYIGRGVGVKKVTYGDFKTKLQAGEIRSIRIFEKSRNLEGEFTDGTKFRSTFLSADRLDALLDTSPVRKIDVDPQNQSIWLSLLTSLLPFIIIIGIFFFLMQQMQGGGNRVMSFGKARAKLVTKDQP